MPRLTVFARGTAAGIAVLCAVGLALAVVAAPAGAAVSYAGGCYIQPKTQCPRYFLNGEDLRNANLAGANFTQANLAGSDLSGADLSGANLTRANLTGVNLAGANLTGANLTTATLEQANLHGATLNTANLTQVYALHANLSSALIQHATLHMANLSHANLDGSQLDYSNVREANLLKVTARSTNFAIADLTSAGFSHADLTGANFYGTVLKQTKIHYTDVRGTSFAHAHFGETSFTGSKANYNRHNGTLLYPSNFNSDETAKASLFVRFYAYINAYGDWGSCRGESGDKDGECVGTAEAGGSHGFNNSPHRGVSWKWTGNYRHLTLTGTDGVQITGHAPGNWATFTPQTVSGLPNVDFNANGQNGELGQPNGPLLIKLTTSYWWERTIFAAIRHTGYVMIVSGWLPRHPD